LTLEQIAGQLSAGRSTRVMGEGLALTNPETCSAGHAKQARDRDRSGFPAACLTTLFQRFGFPEPLIPRNAAETAGISAIYKDLPAANCAWPRPFDYTHRLLDPALAGDEPLDAPDICSATGRDSEIGL